MDRRTPPHTVPLCSSLTEQIVQRIGGLGHDRMTITGSGFNGNMPHQHAERIQRLAGMRGVGVTQHMRGDETLQSDLDGRLPDGALDQVHETGSGFVGVICSTSPALALPFNFPI